MPFITGQANSLQGLLDALTTAIAANGWSNSGICWSKNGCHVSLELTDYRAYGWETEVSRPILRIVAGNGVASGALTDPAPVGHALGTQASYAASGVTFPATYCIHINTSPDEVYFFVNYNVTFWQWLAFGQSPVPGLPGTGNWAGGTFGVLRSGYEGRYERWPNTVITATVGGEGNNDAPCKALFWSTYGNVGMNCTTTIHHGLSGTGWEGTPRASTSAAPRIEYGLARWNNDAILLPIRPITAREDNKVSIIGELAHARYLRIDNYAPGQVITLGQDRWRVYPWYRKDMAAAYYADHSSVFGVALRYDGA